jgi:hypothetical protein
MHAPQIIPGNIYNSRVKGAKMLLRVTQIKLAVFPSRKGVVWRTVYHAKDIDTGKRYRLRTAAHFLEEIILINGNNRRDRTNN